MKRRRKRINQSLMFKNTARFKALKRFSGFLNLLFTLSILTAAVALILAILFPVLYVMLVIISFGLILLSDKNNFLGGSSFMQNAMTVGLIALGAAVVISILKAVIERTYTHAEIKELNIDPQANKNYLDVADAIKKINIYRFVLLAVTMVAVGAVAFAAYSASISKDVQTGFIIGALVVVFGMFIWTSRRRKDVCDSVELSIDEIMKEKRDSRHKAREEKRAQKN